LATDWKRKSAVSRSLLTAAIRRRETDDAHIPIVAMTANVVKGFREECPAAGMDGYVTKPMRRDTHQAAATG
jgi:two-component system sensor histidine kinase/response regulator